LGDISLAAAKKKINNHPHGQAIQFDGSDEKQIDEQVRKADLVISMLPAKMHFPVAKSCVEHGKNMITASYISDEMKELETAAIKNDVLILNEIGVDPGIDHMSAMQYIDNIRHDGKKLIAFESSTGGLISPEYDNNPWNYKFTWNPRNVVVAGQGVSKFLHNGRIKYIPYHKLFCRTEIVNILDMGEFEIYPNRDSLKYQKIYNLENLQTLFRGTIRRPGYSKAWDVFVQLGMTDDTYVVEDSENMTYRDFINAYLAYEKNVAIEEKLARYVGISMDSDIMKKLAWSGIFERKRIGLKNATPAQILQHLIEPKWQLSPDDKDMIVMCHKFLYEYDDICTEMTSTLVVKGKDAQHTAMAATVGIPVGIAAKLLLQNKISKKGVLLPIYKEIYDPVLAELTNYGVQFHEEKKILD
jgi:saccharopine dehydrogenase-like NADP-dependent oxidoreductase